MECVVVVFAGRASFSPYWGYRKVIAVAVEMGRRIHLEIRSSGAKRIRMLTILLSTRFSRSTFSTPRLRLRPVSTSSRYGGHTTARLFLAHHNHQGAWTDSKFSRLLCLRPAPSSWMLSAPAASPSPPSSRTPRPSSFVPVARPSSASPPVARPDSRRAALSGESKRDAPSLKKSPGPGCAD